MYRAPGARSSGICSAGRISGRGSDDRFSSCGGRRGGGHRGRQARGHARRSGEPVSAPRGSVGGAAARRVSRGRAHRDGSGPRDRGGRCRRRLSGDRQRAAARISRRVERLCPTRADGGGVRGHRARVAASAKARAPRGCAPIAGSGTLDRDGAGRDRPRVRVGRQLERRGGARGGECARRRRRGPGEGRRRRGGARAGRRDHRGADREPHPRAARSRRSRGGAGRPLGALRGRRHRGRMVAHACGRGARGPRARRFSSGAPEPASCSATAPGSGWLRSSAPPRSWWHFRRTFTCFHGASSVKRLASG